MIHVCPPPFEVLSASHLQHISSRTHFHILSPHLLSEARPLVAVPNFSPCQAFKSVCAVQTLCALRSHIHTNISCTPCNHLFSYNVTLALFAVGSSLHGCFAFVHRLAIAFVASAATCGVLSSCRLHRNCFDSSNVDMLPRQALPFFPPPSS